MIGVGVVVHQSRLSEAAALTVASQADTWSVDDGTKGCLGNHLDLLARLRSRKPFEWYMALEDDAVVNHSFPLMVPEMLLRAPSPVVCALICETGSRMSYKQQAFREAIEKARDTGNAWILAPFMQNAVGYAIHRSVAHDLFDYVLRHSEDLWAGDYPQIISRWCASRRIRVAYTWPSIVEHSDIPSTINPDLRLVRRAWEFAERSIWDTGHISFQAS